MKKKVLTIVLFILSNTLISFAEDTKIILHTKQSAGTIHKELYGQFAEHLGTCIYGGLWVGNNSSIPNINGYRKDVLHALQDLKVPV